MNEIVIRNDIPIPQHRVGRREKYPFSTMEIGESFAFCSSMSESIRVAASQYSRRTGNKKNFITRQIVEEGRRVIRVWRVA